MFARLILTVLIVTLAGVALAQVRVVASIAPYGDLVRQLGGELVEVTVMLPPGASPHTFEPSPRDAAKLADADLVLLNGGTDEWLGEIAEAVNPEARVVEGLVALEDSLPVSRDTEDSDSEGTDSEGTDSEGTDSEGTDSEDGDSEDGDSEHSASEDEATGEHAHLDVNPHVWLDPILMRQLVGVMAAALAELDPENAEDYLSRSHELRSQLTGLDAELRETLDPVHGAPFIPFHDAWPYFAHRYGLDLVIEIEPFPGREPSPRYLASILEAIRVSRAPAIFNEKGLSDRPARVLADEAGVELFTLDPLGGAGESYQDLMRRNAATLLEALGPWEPR